jgi:phosphoglycerate dehydrogenase-like enzyme
MTSAGTPRIHLGPAHAPAWLSDAVIDGGGVLAPAEECEGIVWGNARDVASLVDTLAVAPHARWVQLPFAGIENFVDHLDHDHVWTCGKGVYAEPVAEMALALGVAGLRNLNNYARATRWSGPAGVNLLGGRVTILGGGGITESLVRLLQPWSCEITVVRRTVQPMDGVVEVLDAARFTEALPGADLVVLALPLTPATEAMIGREELSLMERHAWIVNVARGKHIVTDDLVDALQSATIGGAGLDVTDPEPLPDGHPLWSLPNCIITPHVGNTPAMAEPLLARRVRDNVRRFARGEELIGLVDVDAGY